MNNRIDHKFKGFVAVVDDDTEMRSLLEDFLKQQGYQVFAFENGPCLIEFLKSESEESQKLEVILSDIQMPLMSGIDLVFHIREYNKEVPIILMTAFGSIESAIAAMKKGVFDYITKPFKLNEMLLNVERALQFFRLQSENKLLRNEIKKTYEKGSLLGKSKPMQQVFDLIEKVAHVTANVLITGESGTGKEVVARNIHNIGPRSAKPFIAVNCTAIPENLLESELFGHAKGSFTGAYQRKKGLFEEANGGTIFLDEIGDMDPALQAKLLRVIQEKKIRAVGDNVSRDIDVRIIAATHKDLKAAIKNNLFREDLYYRLAVIPIAIPALRHRKEDIPVLADFFLKKYAAQNGMPAKSLSQGALQSLSSMRWDGNVRELENLIERIVVMSGKSVILESDIPLPEMSNVEDFIGDATRDLPTVEQLEKRYIQIVLEKTGGKKDKAAQILGINRRTLYRKEREYGLVELDSTEDHMFSDEHHETNQPSPQLN